MSLRDQNSITAADPLLTLPVTIEQRTSTGTIVILGALIALSAIVLLMPFALVAAHAVADPVGIFAAISESSVALQLGGALAVAVAFVIVPLRLLIKLAMQPNRITISAAAVTGRSGSGTEWTEPLTAYRGVAHHIRSSLSGARHEIVLVHPEPSKSVVLQTAARIAQPEVDAIAAMLDLGEVPARIMYERPAQTPSIAITQSLDGLSREPRLKAA